MKNNNYISIARIEDTDELMQFIDNEWKKNHILGIDKDYFLYEYGNKKLLNFVISKNKNNMINGMLGFLRSSTDQNTTVWTTMWKVSESARSPMLGICLLNYLREQGYKSVMSSGINQETEEIYKYLGFEVGILKQYFILNKKIEQYRIAVLPDNISDKSLSPSKDESLVFKQIELNDIKENFNFNDYLNRIPYKDFAYFTKRFFEHPIYSYNVYGIFHGSSLLSFIVIRIINSQKSTCMRIVDFYGKENTLATLAWHLSEIMYLNRHEYIDMYSLGLSEKIILRSGFIEIDNNTSDIIIPNYFEPFDQSNVSIRYFTDASELVNLRIYKADGDQDRPSFINNED